MPELTPVTRRWIPANHLWPLLGAGCLGIVVAVSACFAVSVWEDRLAKTKFTNVAGDYGTVLQNGLDQYLGKLLAVRAFYDASVEVDPDEFDLFTKQITAGYDDAMRLVWAPHITRGERAEFEHEQRALGHADFRSGPSRSQIRWRCRPIAMSTFLSSIQPSRPNERPH